jgi:hypothetical protein
MTDEEGRKGRKGRRWRMTGEWEMEGKGTEWGGQLEEMSLFVAQGVGYGDRHTWLTDINTSVRCVG